MDTHTHRRRIIFFLDVCNTLETQIQKINQKYNYVTFPLTVSQIENRGKMSNEKDDKNTVTGEKSNLKFEESIFFEKLKERNSERTPFSLIKTNEVLRSTECSEEIQLTPRTNLFCCAKRRQGDFEDIPQVTNKLEEPTDYNRPPGDSQGYYTQQMVAGRPVYVEGPPPPYRGGREPAYRSGQETRDAREGRQQGGFFSNLFGSDNNNPNDNTDESPMFLFDTVAIRNRFVRKVYTLLSIQLFITFGFIFIAIHTDPIRIFLLRNFTIFIIVMCLTMVFMIALLCCKNVRRNFPCNIICFFILTGLYTYVLATISCIYDTVAVYMATGSCAVICFLVSILACQMKWDITKCGCVLYILMIGLMIYGIVCIILANFVSPETFKVMHMVYGGLGLALFILFLMYDTQLIMGGRSVELSPEEYILGALQLYLDIMMIFQYLLMLFRQ